MSHRTNWIFLIGIIFGCNSNQPNEHFNSNKEKTSKSVNQNEAENGNASLYFSELPSEDFFIKPQNFLVKFSSKLPYKSDSIKFDVIGEVDTTGSGRINELSIFLKNDTFNLKYIDYPILKTKEILNFKRHPPVNFEDYNFDNFPDIAIHNREASGIKNQVYNIYLFNSSKNKYFRNSFLSKVSNPVLDFDNKKLTTFSQGGMASQIYSKSTYKWVNDKYVLIETENQIYSDSLSLYVRTIKELQGESWSTQVDTVKNIELNN